MPSVLLTYWSHHLFEQHPRIPNRHLRYLYTGGQYESSKQTTNCSCATHEKTRIDGAQFDGSGPENLEGYRLADEGAPYETEATLTNHLWGSVLHAETASSSETSSSHLPSEIRAKKWGPTHFQKNERTLGHISRHVARRWSETEQPIRNSGSDRIA